MRRFEEGNDREPPTTSANIFLRLSLNGRIENLTSYCFNIIIPILIFIVTFRDPLPQSVDQHSRTLTNIRAITALLVQTHTSRYRVNSMQTLHQTDITSVCVRPDPTATSEGEKAHDKTRSNVKRTELFLMVKLSIWYNKYPYSKCHFTFFSDFLLRTAGRVNVNTPPAQVQVAQHFVKE